VCKILFLFILLLMLIGLMNRKVWRFIAILAVLMLLCKEIFYQYNRSRFPDDKCFVCDFFKGFSSGRLKYSGAKTFDFTASDSSIIDISSSVGNINITSWDKNIVQINAEKKVRKKKDLERIKIIANKIDERKIIINDADSFAKAQKQGKRIVGQVNYEINVPKKISSLSIKTHVGNVAVANIEGDVKIDVSTGNVDVKNISGLVHLNSDSGNVEVANVNKEVKAEVASGNIYMINIKGVIDSRSKRGNIILKNVYSNVSASTYAGNIDIQKAVGAKGSVAAKTFAGKVIVKDSSGQIISKGTEVTVQ